MMIRNYFKTALRHLKRHKAYTIINILGLSAGIATCLLIFAIIQYETSFDTFQVNYDRIYQPVTKDVYPDGENFNPGIPYPALEALRQDLPEIKTGALFCNYGCQVAVTDANGQTIQDKKFIEDVGGFFMDPEFFQVFQFKWLSGSPAVLAQPNMVVLARSVADKYFGDWKQAIGHSLKIDNRIPCTVAGILEDVPANSDFPLRVVGSLVTIKNITNSNPIYGYNSDWGNITSSFQLYMLLPPGEQPARVDAELKALAAKYYKNQGSNKRYNFLRPLRDMHFDDVVGNLGTHVTSRTMLATLSLIAFLIIVMACINFVNLSTAQAVGRSKEIGVRKVLGGYRLQLFWQMISETNILVVIASILAIAFAFLAAPYLRHVISMEETLPVMTWQSMCFLIITVIILTLMAGFYPALILSGFKPVLALKNRISSDTIGGLSLRRVLVVIQFSISQLLIIGTLVAVAQMSFIRHADLGFNKDAILILNGSDDETMIRRLDAFRQQLQLIPGVKAVSFCNDPPSSNSNWGTNFAFNHKPDENYTLYLKYADSDYFRTFGLQFLAGKEYAASDTATAIVINETLLKKLGLKSAEDAVGKELRTGGNSWKTICGVVKDFHANSMREEIKPLMIAAGRKFYYRTSVKLHTTNLARTQEAVQQAWNRQFPEFVYSASFLDERIEAFYEQETKMALLYKIFAGLAILISSLGLYGLVSFMAVQKTKEVGIRKVLGARVSTILLLFSKEFTWLLVIAFVIAAPLAYYYMNSWLENFVFRIHVGAGTFTIAFFFSICIAWVSVGYKALRAATANPVKSIRTE